MKVSQIGKTAASALALFFGCIITSRSQTSIDLKGNWICINYQDTIRIRFIDKSNVQFRTGNVEQTGKYQAVLSNGDIVVTIKSRIHDNDQNITAILAKMSQNQYKLKEWNREYGNGMPPENDLIPGRIYILNRVPD